MELKTSKRDKFKATLYLRLTQTVDKSCEDENNEVAHSKLYYCTNIFKIAE